MRVRVRIMCFGGFGRARKRWIVLGMIKMFRTVTLPRTESCLIDQSFIRFCISISFEL